MNILIFTILAAVCFLFALFRIVYNKVTLKNIPRYLRGIHIALYCVLLVIFALIPYTIGYKYKHQGEYLILIGIVEIISLIFCIYISMDIDEFLRWQEKNKDRIRYKSITASDVANQFEMEYIQKIPDLMHSIGVKGEMYFQIEQRRFLEFLPLNTVQSYQQIIWQDNFMKYDEYSPYENVITNANSFKEIENICSILLQMVKIYQHVLEEDLFISCYDFALKLEKDARPDYKGKAELVLLEKTVLNNKVSLKERQEVRKKCMSEFINCFMGYNFGNIIRSNDELKEEFNKLYLKAKNRKLIIPLPRRERIIQNKDVQKYNYGGIKL